MTDKIRISLEDINTADVDRKVQQQAMLNRVTDHYGQQVSPTQQLSAGGGGFFRNSLVYMTVFGFLGGLLAWPVTETISYLLDSDAAEYREAMFAFEYINNAESQGEISQADAELAYENIAAKFEDNPGIKILADESISESEKGSALEKLGERWRIQELLDTFLLITISAISIAFFISIADSVISKNFRQTIVSGSLALCIGLVGGGIGAFVAQFLYSVMGGGDVESGLLRQVMARAFGWALAGLFLAIAPGLIMRSPKKFFSGLAGGFLGGLIGGLLFDAVSFATGTVWLSRLIGLASIGTFAGLGTGLIENVVKTGWLKVTAGLIAGKQFILYKNPTVLGSSPQCEIYLFKDINIAPQHAKIRRTPSGYEIVDLGTNTGTFVNGQQITRKTLRPKDQIQISTTVFAFDEKGKH